LTGVFTHMSKWRLAICGIPRRHALFLTALGAVAGVVNVLANSVALVVPFLGGSRDADYRDVRGLWFARLINIRGVRQGAGAVTVITLAKLLPLCCSFASEYFLFTRRILPGAVGRAASR